MNIRQDLSLIASLVPERSTALDIGCGDGSLLKILRERRGVRGYGLEIDPADVSRAVADGLSVVQGDADTDLRDYPDEAFDTVILSNSVQTLRHPERAISGAVRVGRNVIVSFPNFGHWRVRAHLALHGTMPMSRELPTPWYATENIHLCTIKDFLYLTDNFEMQVREAYRLNQGASPKRFDPSAPFWPNWRAEAALFVLSRP
ncbi:methionine biosynthesis protein MetW [Parvularcula sp. LCG005]|uniref:methionine biosynthesis protein MetW n=1 Tax=Parvularcula sp. LCG005 TaxID=3078805 RepID=UPI0029423DF0|nr:methionine biosynthesis protein MetW [Parvularcula sp. LCG005]WOI52871.1 methionine biosynthesis protein MetW [Parvularcula sp. LCG005]